MKLNMSRPYLLRKSSFYRVLMRSTGVGLVAGGLSLHSTLLMPQPAQAQATPISCAATAINFSTTNANENLSGTSPYRLEQGDIVNTTISGPPNTRVQITHNGVVVADITLGVSGSGSANFTIQQAAEANFQFVVNNGAAGLPVTVQVSCTPVSTAAGASAANAAVEAALDGAIIAAHPSLINGDVAGEFGIDGNKLFFDFLLRRQKEIEQARRQTKEKAQKEDEEAEAEPIAPVPGNNRAQLIEAPVVPNREVPERDARRRNDSQDEARKSAAKTCNGLEEELNALLSERTKALNNLRAAVNNPNFNDFSDRNTFIAEVIKSLQSSLDFEEPAVSRRDIAAFFLEQGLSPGEVNNAFDQATFSPEAAAKRDAKIAVEEKEIAESLKEGQPKLEQEIREDREKLAKLVDERHEIANKLESLKDRLLDARLRERELAREVLDLSFGPSTDDPRSGALTEEALEKLAFGGDSNALKVASFIPAGAQLTAIAAAINNVGFFGVPVLSLNNIDIGSDSIDPVGQLGIVRGAIEKLESEQRSLNETLKGRFIDAFSGTDRDGSLEKRIDTIANFLQINQNVLEASEDAQQNDPLSILGIERAQEIRDQAEFEAFFEVLLPNLSGKLFDKTLDTIETLDAKIEAKQAELDKCKEALARQASVIISPRTRVAMAHKVATHSVAKNQTVVRNNLITSAYAAPNKKRNFGVTAVSNYALNAKFDLREWRNTQRISKTGFSDNTGNSDSLLFNERFNIFGSLDLSRSRNSDTGQRGHSIGVSGGFSWVLFPSVNVGLAGRYQTANVDSTITKVDSNTWGIAAFAQGQIKTDLAPINLEGVVSYGRTKLDSTFDQIGTNGEGTATVLSAQLKASTQFKVENISISPSLSLTRSHAKRSNVALSNGQLTPGSSGDNWVFAAGTSFGTTFNVFDGNFTLSPSMGVTASGNLAADPSNIGLSLGGGLGIKSKGGISGNLGVGYSGLTQSAQNLSLRGSLTIPLK